MTKIKKSLFFIILNIILVFSLTPVFAGSIPEDLLGSDDALVFFAELVELDIEKDNIKVMPTKKIKGDVSVGNEIILDKPYIVGSFTAKKGNVYLITHYDEFNPAYILETTGTDTKTLRLKNVNGGLWMRFEGYLNEGKYEQAEKQRIEKLIKKSVGDGPAFTSYHSFLKLADYIFKLFC